MLYLSLDLMFYFLLLFYSTCLWYYPKGFYIYLLHVHFFVNGHIEDQTSHGYTLAFEKKNILLLPYPIWFGIAGILVCAAVGAYACTTSCCTIRGPRNASIYKCVIADLVPNSTPSTIVKPMLPSIDPPPYLTGDGKGGWEPRWGWLDTCLVRGLAFSLSLVKVYYR